MGRREHISAGYRVYGYQFIPGSPSPPMSTATGSGRSAHRAASPSRVSPTKSCSAAGGDGSPPRAAGTRSPAPKPRPLPGKWPRSRPTRPPRALVPGQTLVGRPLRWRSSRPANPRAPRSAFATDPSGRSGGRPPSPRDWFFAAINTIRALLATRASTVPARVHD